MDEYRLELENRIRNLLWTVSGDYQLDMKPDVSLFLRSKAIALYDGIKQGALARYYDKDMLGLYLVKKIFLQAGENELTFVAQLCIEEAIGDKICEERPGIRDMQRQCMEDILEQEFDILPDLRDIPGRLKVAVLRRRLNNGEWHVEKKLQPFMELIERAGNSTDTLELIRVIDELYNRLMDPNFESMHGTLEQVLAVTMEDLTEYSWEDFLSEEMYEEVLESYAEQLTNSVSGLENSAVTEEMEEKRQKKRSVKVVTPEMLEKAYTYVELNYGKSYLSEAEEKKINYQMCRGIHSDCSLYFTEGILKNPVKSNYQYEYAKRLRNKNIWLYHDKHRIVKHNITVLTETLRKSLVLRSETQTVLSDRGMIVPSRLWRIGRSNDAKLFQQELKGEISDFVVDVLIDASGSQMKRQGDVALQAYIISEALSNVDIPYRVMSFCTFWDYTIMHRFRRYDDPRSENDNIFNYVTSSNNRDGLAIRTAGYDLLQREEEKKIMIILSDGRPYDVIINRPNAKNPEPYQGKAAIADTATEVRRLRNLDVSVLGVFAGEEKDLATEKKIFGKDFAYIRDIANFSKIVGRYLTKQLEIDG
ncbi:nitric oxide reductase activation protein [Blautia obeum]|uniref:Nitric oxide reductase activation protein n=1 Tax=Blautia obeum TaxID=40520 RepID=A0A396FQF9_9FIRM|nr:nitric oxide reductase activation protein [Blautia obeum]RGR48085.1 nitric oxide reductase activation protein [Blautia obeum]RGZ07332.1 nitric oxide reductase activation protein [Blautia obeum]RHE12641.1 nitric oxide reductase activation protein [Blautia obeum]RHE71995.1 nitric oxide reductase activation protein [Blautia obeum]